MFLSMDEYKFIKFEKSTMKNKKYDALFRNNTTGKIEKLSFGDQRFAQYRDSAGLDVSVVCSHASPWGALMLVRGVLVRGVLSC